MHNRRVKKASPTEIPQRIRCNGPGDSIILRPMPWHGKTLAGGVLAAAILVVAVCLSAQPSKDAPSQPKPGAVLARFAIAPGGQPIVVPVTMGDQAYPFLVDIGASLTTFDRSLEEHLGNPKETLEAGVKDGKPVSVSLYYAPAATVGGLSLRRGGAVLCVDLEDLRTVSGLDVRGVLGMGFLRRYVLRVDFDDGTLEFLAPPPEAPEDWGQRIAFRTNAYGCPFVLGELPGERKVPFALDSGLGEGAILEAELFDSLREEGVILKVATAQVAYGDRQVQTVMGRIPAIRVGPWTYHNLLFDRGQAGNRLGLSFLARHGVVLDFPHSCMYLTKGERFTERARADMSGLHLLRRDGAILVHAVDADSPAGQAGIQAGDVLESIDDSPIGEYNLYTIRARLRRKADDKVTVTILRDGESRRVRFSLREPI